MSDEKSQLSRRAERTLLLMNLAAKCTCLGGWAVAVCSALTTPPTAIMPVTVSIGTATGIISLLFIKATSVLLETDEQPKPPKKVDGKSRSEIATPRPEDHLS